MADTAMTQETRIIGVAVDLPAPDMFSAMTDRELLEYVARNALTADTLVAAVESRVPELLEKFGENPLIRTVLKFL